MTRKKQQKQTNEVRPTTAKKERSLYLILQKIVSIQKNSHEFTSFQPKRKQICLQISKYYRNQILENVFSHLTYVTVVQDSVCISNNEC